MVPNLVIFRANSIVPKFVELPYLGNLLSKSGDIITGPYSSLNTDEIVLSRITQTGSIQLGRFTIKTDNKKLHIFELAYHDLAELVTHLMMQVINPAAQLRSRGV